MKSWSLIFMFLFLQTFSMVSQNKKELSIFINSQQWKTEVILFPIAWAPKLKVNGFEELLFTPNWSHPESDEFWSLVIGWKVDATTPLSIKEIQYNLASYFDGLMKPNHWASKFPEPKVYFKKQKNAKTFRGKMTFFDGFHTGKITTVYIQGEQYYFKSHQKSIIVFRISPKNLKHRIWRQLKTITLKKTINNGKL